MISCSIFCQQMSYFLLPFSFSSLKPRSLSCIQKLFLEKFKGVFFVIFLLILLLRDDLNGLISCYPQFPFVNKCPISSKQRKNRNKGSSFFHSLLCDLRTYIWYWLITLCNYTKKLLFSTDVFVILSVLKNF